MLRGVKFQISRQTPFYVALPYNDVLDDHTTKSEARQIIPWFRNTFVRPGQSVCQGRWVALRHAGKVFYAQWLDCGPFTTTDAAYVFGAARPLPNRNHDAGIDVSPAVRDYLELNEIDQCDWKFVNQPPPGPWTHYGQDTVARLTTK